MKEYTVVYIVGTEEYARDTYKPGTAIKEIVKELSRYCKDCDYITIFDANDEEDILYFKVLNIHGHYVLVELF